MLFYPKGVECVATWMEDGVRHVAKLDQIDDGMVINTSERMIPKGAVVTFTYATATLTDVHRHDSIDYGRTWNILQINDAADCLARSRQAAIMWLLENFEALKAASENPAITADDVANAIAALREGGYLNLSFNLSAAVKAVLNNAGDGKSNRVGDEK